MEFLSLSFLFGDLSQLDTIVINWSQTTIHLLNFAIGFIMFGVALKIKPQHFKDLLTTPKPILVGTICQYMLLPAITFVLVMIFRPSVGVALGMILVAACPGANVSNLFSSISRSNVALAISLTAITVPMSLIMTPLNFWLWGTLYVLWQPEAIPWLVIDPIEMFRLVFLILGIPVILGMFVGNQFPIFAKSSEKYVQGASLAFFITFIGGALAANFSFFIQVIHLIFIIALIHNASAFWIGYRVPRLFGIDRINSRTISFETGVQNSGLGVALFFTVFPPELQAYGGIAIIAAWWGVWQVIPGLALSFYWRKRPVKQAEVVAEEEE